MNDTPAAESAPELFQDHYVDWRQKRIALIEDLFSKEFFHGKRILELGCGLGDIGKYFQTLGATVCFADGRPEYLKEIKAADPSAETVVIDQEDTWFLNQPFDIIIHWGVLYHLNNWSQDLACAIRQANLIFLESEVCDSDDPTVELKVSEPSGYDQALHQVGSRPSAGLVEHVVRSLGAEITRYDDPRLTSGMHHYDWVPQNTITWRAGLRRFWVIRKPA